MIEVAFYGGICFIIAVMITIFVIKQHRENNRNED